MRYRRRWDITRRRFGEIATAITIMGITNIAVCFVIPMTTAITMLISVIMIVSTIIISVSIRSFVLVYEMASDANTNKYCCFQRTIELILKKTEKKGRIDVKLRGW